jgi:hypothetical protein
LTSSFSPALCWIKISVTIYLRLSSFSYLLIDVMAALTTVYVAEPSYIPYIVTQMDSSMLSVLESIPLTTIFTPQSDCFKQPVFWESSLYVAPILQPQCFPSQVMTDYELSQIFSPGICPFAFSTVHAVGYWRGENCTNMLSFVSLPYI